MKIIAVDNYNRDNVDDVLVCENVNEYYGKILVKDCNRNQNDVFLRLVDDDTVLYKFEP